MKSYISIGIDPGLTGAVAAVDASGRLTLCEDMPTMALPGGTRKQRCIDAKGLAKILARATQGADEAIVTVEAVGASAQRGPGRQGTVSAASLGDSRGAIRATIAVMGLEGRWLQPASWKAKAGLTGHADPKNASRLLASSYWGQELFTRVRDHDRAEAALLAAVGLSDATGLGMADLTRRHRAEAHGGAGGDSGIAWDDSAAPGWLDCGGENLLS